MGTIIKEGIKTLYWLAHMFFS